MRANTFFTLVASGSAALAQTMPANGTTAVTTTTSAISASSTADCAEGVHILVARGSGEDPGTGISGIVADNITEKIPGSSIEAVDYAASFTQYISSVGDGMIAMKSQFNSYLEKCPNGKVVLMGFSQGAHIASNVICGNTDGPFAETDDLADKFEKNVIAVVMFGNPAHMANASWNAGTSTNDGIFPREDDEGCTPYVPKMRSWCDTGDVYCDGGDEKSVHASYFSNYNDDATAWVVDLYQSSLEKDDSSDEDTDESTDSTGTGSSATATETDEDSQVTETGEADTVPDSGACSQFTMRPASLAILAIAVGALGFW